MNFITLIDSQCNEERIFTELATVAWDVAFQENESKADARVSFEDLILLEDGSGKISLQKVI